MADTTQPLQNIIYYDPASVRKIAVAGGETIYRGAIVCYDAQGEATPADDSGPMIGFAIETVKNTTAEGGGTDRDKFVRVARRGQAVYSGTANLAASTGLNAICYATDDQTVTDVDPGNTNIVGRIAAFEDITVRHGMTNAVIVDFDLGS